MKQTVEYTRLIPIQQANSIIIQYIFSQKGIKIQLAPVVRKEDEEKYIQALNIACNYFNVTI